MTSIFDLADATMRWTSDHWWSQEHRLQTSDGETAVVVRVSGSKGTVGTREGTFALKRLRLPRYMRLPRYITLQDSETESSVARFCLIPNRGLLAEFEGGSCYRWGNTGLGKASWSNEQGENVLTYARREIKVEVAGAGDRRLPLLAALVLAKDKLSVPWF